jgi:hypothetical protein
VKHTGGFFLPAQARAIRVFEAGSAADVAAASQRAGVPFTEVVEAVDVRLAGPLSGAGPANSRRESC